MEIILSLSFSIAISLFAQKRINKFFRQNRFVYNQKKEALGNENQVAEPRSEIDEQAREAIVKFIECVFQKSGLVIPEAEEYNFTSLCWGFVRFLTL